ncbi:MAG: hypothetical protein DRJ42_29045 [Deltaproteobacteria bacterium]|nr:MAG: hypothetical protein DRJ42_29045 [Deltaproteobacteria bacterium]
MLDGSNAARDRLFRSIVQDSIFDLRPVLVSFPENGEAQARHRADARWLALRRVWAWTETLRPRLYFLTVIAATNRLPSTESPPRLLLLTWALRRRNRGVLPGAEAQAPENRSEGNRAREGKQNDLWKGKSHSIPCWYSGNSETADMRGSREAERYRGCSPRADVPAVCLVDRPVRSHREAHELQLRTRSTVKLASGRTHDVTVKDGFALDPVQGRTLV